MKKISTIAFAILLFGSGLSNANEADDFDTFLGKYHELKELNKAYQKSQSSSTKISGNLQFAEQKCDESVSACPCPEGNNYLECLIGGTATIKADINDIGGQGYVAVMSSDRTNGTNGIIDKNGDFLSWPVKHYAYTKIIKNVKPSNEFSFMAPSGVASACRKIRADQQIEIGVGFGVVSAYDVEFSERMKKHPDLGKDFDENKFLFSKAQTDGYKKKKFSFIGTGYCRDGIRDEPGGA